MAFSIAVIGGGAAGFFGALESKRRLPHAEVVILEQSNDVLTKVRLSGGGRCNLTHACFDPKELVKRYPRGRSFLLPLFYSFQPTDTITWFQEHGVQLHTEPDGRVFPQTNSSDTVIACLVEECRKQGVRVEKGVHIQRLISADGKITIEEREGNSRCVDAVLLATGSAREPLKWLEAFSISLISQVPSLFAINCSDSFIKQLSGLSVQDVDIHLFHMHARGALLVTHFGFSGPAILTISSYLARELAECSYQASFTIDWLPRLSGEDVRCFLLERKKSYASRTLAHTPFEAIPSPLWQALLVHCGIDKGIRWAELSKREIEMLKECLKKTCFLMDGKRTNKQEFVTAGGVSLEEVYPKSLESKKIPGLFFAGEILYIDGITGGFNLQAAWTTAYIAAEGMARKLLSL